jgi:hypothetical protein
VLHNGQIPQKLHASLIASHELCDLLAGGPAIGTTAAGYL